MFGACLNDWLCASKVDVIVFEVSWSCALSVMNADALVFILKYCLKICLSVLL